MTTTEERNGLNRSMSEAPYVNAIVYNIVEVVQCRTMKQYVDEFNKDIYFSFFLYEMDVYTPNRSRIDRESVVTRHSS